MPPRTRTAPLAADHCFRRTRERRAALPYGSPQGAPADRPPSPSAPDPPRPTRTTDPQVKTLRRHLPTQVDGQLPGPARAHRPRPLSLWPPMSRVVAQRLCVDVTNVEHSRYGRLLPGPCRLPTEPAGKERAGSIGLRIRGTPQAAPVRFVSANRATAQSNVVRVGLHFAGSE